MNLVWVMGLGQVSSKKKRRKRKYRQNPKFKFKIVPSFIISYCVSPKGNTPSASASGISARATSASSRSGFCRTAQIPGNEPFKQKPAASWGDDSPLPSALPRFVLVSLASRRAGQGSPHPAAQTPLRFFMSVFVVSLSLLDFSMLYHTGARL